MPKPFRGGPPMDPNTGLPPVTPLNAGGGPGSHPLLPKAPPLPPPPGAPNISAQEDPTLQAIDAQYAKYADDLQNNTGRILNQATSATRDAFAGIRGQAGEDAALRGVGGGDTLRDIDNATGRAIAGQHAQIARNREEQMADAMGARAQARLGAIGSMQGEKRIGLDAYGAQNQAMAEYNRLNAQNAATAFDQLLAVMQAQRTSPTPVASPFGGAAAPAMGYGGGGYGYRPTNSSRGYGRGA